MDDILALIGLLMLLTGLYLWLGPAAPLIVGGLALIWIGVRWPARPASHLDLSETEHGQTR